MLPVQLFQCLCIAFQGAVKIVFGVKYPSRGVQPHYLHRPVVPFGEIRGGFCHGFFCRDIGEAIQVGKSNLVEDGVFGRFPPGGVAVCFRGAAFQDGEQAVRVISRIGGNVGIIPASALTGRQGDKTQKQEYFGFSGHNFHKFIINLHTKKVKPMISYYYEDTKFVFKGKQRNNRWLRLVAESEIRRAGDISIIFCSDNYILDINMKYLQHDYFTDIITFDYCEGDKISGDLFISIDSVRENALLYGTEFEDELNRVMVHGVLHLIGYDDHTKAEQKTMREKENYYLSLRELV